MQKAKSANKILTEKGAKRAGKNLNKRGQRVLLILLLAAFLCLLGQKYLPYWLYPTPYYDDIIIQAERAGLDPKLVLAVAKVESNFSAEAVSPVGAIGVMQLMPNTAEWLAERNGEDFSADSLYDPVYNIKMGTEYLHFLLDYWDWDVDKAIASYNAGQSKVAEWLNNGTWDGTSANAADIPYEETRAYLRKVLDVYQRYNRLY